MLARIGLAAPPYTWAAMEVQAHLRQLELHLASVKDARGMVLAKRLHQRLQRVIEQDVPPGAVDLVPLSGGLPKPPEDP
jgi:pyrimidine operon attenuation protein/uracil phosphoribosyltransferase